MGGEPGDSDRLDQTWGLCLLLASGKAEVPPHACVFFQPSLIVGALPSEVARQPSNWNYRGGHRRGQAGATRARKLAAVNSFFGHLEDCGIIAHNPAKGTPRPKQEVKQPRVLTEKEYGRLREVCQSHSHDRALIELFLQTGLRLSEVANPTLADLELPPKDTARGLGAVTVVGKGRKRRTVSLNWKACDALRVYLSGRTSRHTSPVFLSKSGVLLTPTGRATSRRPSPVRIVAWSSPSSGSSPSARTAASSTRLRSLMPASRSVAGGYVSSTSRRRPPTRSW